MNSETIIALVGVILGGGAFQFIAGLLKDRREGKRDHELKPERERGVALESAEKAVVVLDASLRAEATARQSAEERCSDCADELAEARKENETLRVHYRARIAALEAEADAVHGELRAMMTRYEALSDELSRTRGDLRRHAGLPPADQ